MIWRYAIAESIARYAATFCFDTPRRCRLATPLIRHCTASYAYDGRRQFFVPSRLTSLVAGFHLDSSPRFIAAMLSLRLMLMVDVYVDVTLARHEDTRHVYTCFALVTPLTPTSPLLCTSVIIMRACHVVTRCCDMIMRAQMAGAILLPIRDI